MFELVDFEPAQELVLWAGGAIERFDIAFDIDRAVNEARALGVEQIVADDPRIGERRLGADGRGVGGAQGRQGGAEARLRELRLIGDVLGLGGQELHELVPVLDALVKAHLRHGNSLGAPRLVGLFFGRGPPALQFAGDGLDIGLDALAHITGNGGVDHPRDQRFQGRERLLAGIDGIGVGGQLRVDIGQRPHRVSVQGIERRQFDGCLGGVVAGAVAGAYGNHFME